MVVQVLRGFMLSLYYNDSVNYAFYSVRYLILEVENGYEFRFIHARGASLLFFLIFIHIGRAIWYKSYYIVEVWESGTIIFLLMIIVSFLGYVLPWGQISFWGATVITNLLRVLPIGKTLVIWLWGGFYVSSFTCRFFYALHFLLPFLIIGLAIIHLILLHFRGRSTPGTTPTLLKIKFSYFFIYKDIVNLTILWGLLIFLLKSPDWSADPVNFVPSDLSRSPIHIQPEWYFLHLYAVLRSIPNKLGGLIGFSLAILILRSLALSQARHRLHRFDNYDRLAWAFIRINLILIWLGRQPVEAPYILIGQVSATFYFISLISILLLDSTVKLLSF